MMRKNRSNRRRSHRRSRRHHSKTMKRGGSNDAIASLYKPVKSVAQEPVLLADKVGKNVSDTLKNAQVSLLQGQYKAKEQTRKVTDAVKGFGDTITNAFKSLFGGGRKSRRRHAKRQSN